MEREPLFVVAVDAERPVRAQRLIRSDGVLLWRSGPIPCCARNVHYKKHRDRHRSKRGYADIRGFGRHCSRHGRLTDSSWKYGQIYPMPAVTQQSICNMDLLKRSPMARQKIIAKASSRLTQGV